MYFEFYSSFLTLHMIGPCVLRFRINSILKLSFPILWIPSEKEGLRI